MNKRSDIKQLKANAQEASVLLKSLAHPERLLILCQLVQGELCVGELLKQSQLGQSAFSQHLSVLKRNALVKTRKEAQMVYYSLADEKVNAILTTLYDLYCR